MTNRKLLLIDTKIDDLALLQVPIFREFRGISQIWEVATAKRIVSNGIVTQ